PSAASATFLPEPDMPPMRMRSMLSAVLHELLLPLDELARAVDPALVEHEVAHRGLDQHGEVAARGDGDRHLADRYGQHFLVGRIDLQAVEVAERLVAVVLEVHEQPQQL